MTESTVPARSARQVSVSYMTLGILFCTCLVTANLLETKLIDVGGFFTVTAGLIIFPISYIIGDVTTELWGFRGARRLIWMGFAMNFFTVAVCQVAVMLPAPDYWAGGEHFNFVFNMAPRIAVASLTAFVVGSLTNAWVMAAMRRRDGDRRFSLRAIVSTLAGEGADSLIFFPMAFAGLVPAGELLGIMLLQVLLKTLYEIIVLPITIQVVKYFKRREGMA